MCTLESGHGVSLEAAGVKGVWEAEVLLPSHSSCYNGCSSWEEDFRNPPWLQREQDRAISRGLQGFSAVVCSTQGHNFPEMVGIKFQKDSPSIGCNWLRKVD